MKDQRAGPELIQEYIRTKEDEFIKEYDPAVAAEIKER
jgi:hypothetical protein